MDVLDKLALEM